MINDKTSKQGLRNTSLDAVCKMNNNVKLILYILILYREISKIDRKIIIIYIYDISLIDETFIVIFALTNAIAATFTDCTHIFMNHKNF